MGEAVAHGEKNTIQSEKMPRIKFYLCHEVFKVTPGLGATLSLSLNENVGQVMSGTSSGDLSSNFDY